LHNHPVGKTVGYLECLSLLRHRLVSIFHCSCSIILTAVKVKMVADYNRN
jgi:hypothetical protein